jgi:beta-lactamase superfamily II metal-dependent hydrolase
MACCNPYREQVGLSCDYGWQIGCGTNELARLATHTPSSVPQFLSALLQTFPLSAGVIAEHAVRVGHVDDFVVRAAFYCAALQTKTERNAFRTQIAGYLSAEQLAQLDKLMAAEWSRLRSK